MTVSDIKVKNVRTRTLINWTMIHGINPNNMLGRYEEPYMAPYVSFNSPVLNVSDHTLS